MSDVGPDRETELYRHYDKEGDLLYVGIAYATVHRLAAHRYGSGWFRDIEIVTIERFHSRAQAMEAEAAAIKDEKPRFNVIHADDMLEDTLQPERIADADGRKVTYIRFSDEERALLQKAAREEGQPMTTFVRVAAIAAAKRVLRKGKTG